MRPGSIAAMTVALAGCELVFPLAGPESTDAAIDPAACSRLFTGSITEITSFDDAPTEFDPAFTGDPQELFLTIDDVSGGGRHIHSARGTPTEGYGTPVRVLLGASQTDTDPALTRDGLDMVFLSSRSPLVFETSRATTGQPFSLLPSNPLELPDNIRGLDITPDGLAIYFQDGDDNLAFARRPSRSESFAAPHVQLGFQGSFPSISADEREIYYVNNDSAIVRRRREDPAAGFGGEEKITESGGDPEISIDGTTLVFAADLTLFAMTRPCP